MTIDAGNSSRIVESIIPTKNEPPGIVSTDAVVKGSGYVKRLFFYPIFRHSESRILSKRGVPHHSWWVPVKQLNRPQESRFTDAENRSRNCHYGGKNVEIWRNCLAFSAKIYYNNMLYNVVGPRFMQGVAGLRKVAEVVIMYFVYLTLPHIANSKGTVVAK